MRYNQCSICRHTSSTHYGPGLSPSAGRHGHVLRCPFVPCSVSRHHPCCWPKPRERGCCRSRHSRPQSHRSGCRRSSAAIGTWCTSRRLGRRKNVGYSIISGDGRRDVRELCGFAITHDLDRGGNQCRTTTSTRACLREQSVSTPQPPRLKPSDQGSLRVVLLLGEPADLMGTT
jgi:hypothetical protein